MTKEKQKEVAQQDEPIFEGGPTAAQVEEWKALYGSIYMTEVDADEAYIWRVLRRPEWRELMANEGNSVMEREDLICNACVLWPSAPSLAGTPTVLSEQIIDKSGFVSKGGPVKL